MDRPEYLDKYYFNWQSLDIMASGMSSIDVEEYLTPITSKEEAEEFLYSYGYDLEDPIQSAEIFGNYQESIQFLKKYFLKEGNEEDGLDLTVPTRFYTITDVRDLILIATRFSSEITEEESMWAGIILKVMNTILHLDKDLRHRYFTTIQTQIFDRFYKYLHREGDKLYLEDEASNERIPLYEFETKSKKARESIIIKLLHKKENVAEELFDRIGVRFITQTKFDCLRVLSFLHQNHIVMVNNIKPSRSQNSLINLKDFSHEYLNLVKDAISEKFDEADFNHKAELLINNYLVANEDKKNVHSLEDYRAIHFTTRQLIKYKNPFYLDFKKLKEEIQTMDREDEITKKIMALDSSSIARDIRFFYPFEVQITDLESHKNNTKGEASHQEYKRSQIQYAMKRLFSPLINFKK